MNNTSDTELNPQELQETINDHSLDRKCGRAAATLRRQVRCWYVHWCARRV